MSSPKDQETILTLPHEQIESMQLEGIKRTVVRCYENIPFYKKSFDEAGFDPYSVRSLDDLAKAPFTTKQDLRDNYPYGLFARPLEDCVEIHMSSGTTGIATVGGYTEHDLDFWGDCFGRGVLYGGGGKGDVMNVCYGYGLFTGGLGAHYGGQSAGCLTIPMSAGNTKRHDHPVLHAQLRDAHRRHGARDGRRPAQGLQAQVRHPRRRAHERQLPSRAGAQARL